MLLIIFQSWALLAHPTLLPVGAPAGHAHPGEGTGWKRGGWGHGEGPPALPHQSWSVTQQAFMSTQHVRYAAVEGINTVLSSALAEIMGRFIGGGR